MLILLDLSSNLELEFSPSSSQYSCDFVFRRSTLLRFSIKLRFPANSSICVIIIFCHYLLVEACVNGINHALDSGTPDELMTYLLKPEALLPRVDPSRPYLYFDNLKKARVDKAQVYRVIILLRLSFVNNLFMIFSYIILPAKEISCF